MLRKRSATHVRDSPAEQIHLRFGAERTSGMNERALAGVALREFFLGSSKWLAT